MSNRSHLLPILLLIFFVSLAACKYAGDDQPITYRYVTSVGMGRDTIEPFGIAVKDDVIYVSDGATGVIRKIVRDGGPSVFASGLHTPSAIAFLPSGELVVADTGSHTIRKMSEDGAVSIVAGVDGRSGSNDGPALSATFNAPVGIAVDADGVIYVSDTYNDRIRSIRDGVVATIAGDQRGFADGVGLSASFDTPLGIAVWRDKVLVADSGNARIRVIEKNGVVSTIAGGGSDRDFIDGSLASARFVNPTAIAVDELDAIFVADDNAIRVIGRRAFPMVETLAGGRRGFLDDETKKSRFNRPSGIAVGSKRELYIADSDNRAIRVVSDSEDVAAGKHHLGILDQDKESFPLASSWPFDPPGNPREIAGTLGEIRGEVKPDGKPVWFHNGLDIAGAYGETAKFIRDETVLDPRAAENFGTSRELLRLPLIGYIHLRLGRDKDNRLFDDPRFQFERDPSGKLVGVRVPRGTRFAAGNAIGTLNGMNHVHLIAGRNGYEINALAALQLPGVSDSISPVIEDARIFDVDWNELKAQSGERAIRLPDRVRVVVRAYDRMDGNSERRRLGVYRVGYHIFARDSPVGEIDWRISFDRSPSNEGVRLAYAEGSRSGYTADTIFNYIATNHVSGEDAREDFLDTSQFPPGRYTLRVSAADYFGNVGSKDVEVLK